MRNHNTVGFLYQLIWIANYRLYSGFCYEFGQNLENFLAGKLQANLATAFPNSSTNMRTFVKVELIEELLCLKVRSVV